jgi:hypothetical protein
MYRVIHQEMVSVKL